MSVFGDNVKQMREAKGWSQDELAIKAGYTSRSTISCIESGKRDSSQKQILAIANALGVTPGELLENKEKSTPQTKRDVLKQKIVELLAQLNEDELKDAARYLDYLINSRGK